MRVTEWPIYISDTFYVECRADGCDDPEFDHPGRRVQVHDLLTVIKAHAKEAHGVDLVVPA